MRVLQEIRERFAGMVRTLPLCEATTWRIGGPALVLDLPTVDVLAEALALAESTGVPWFVLGRGSNVLAADEGYEGMVVRLSGQLAAYSIRRRGPGFVMRAGGGAPLPCAAGAACMAGASGMEFAAGIPGTVGGAVFMNAGAYGGSMADLVTGVTAVDTDGSTIRLDGVDCDFDYRSSLFQRRRLVVTAVELYMPSGDAFDIKREATRLLEERRRKYPLDLPNAGSVFRRPDKGPPPGKLVEDAGMKGETEGDAEISRLHANFIVNKGHATASDVRRLVERAKKAVLSSSGILLREEIRYLGQERKHG